MWWISRFDRQMRGTFIVAFAFSFVVRFARYIDVQRPGWWLNLGTSLAAAALVGAKEEAPGSVRILWLFYSLWVPSAIWPLDALFMRVIIFSCLWKLTNTLLLFLFLLLLLLLFAFQNNNRNWLKMKSNATSSTSTWDVQSKASAQKALDQLYSRNSKPVRWRK